MGKILSLACSWEVEHTQLDTVGILLSLRKPTLWSRWVLGNRSKLILPSFYALPSSYAARLKRSDGFCLQPSVLLMHCISVEKFSTDKYLCSHGLPLPDPAVCFEYRAQVFSSGAKHCKQVRGIVLRGKKT